MTCRAYNFFPRFFYMYAVYFEQLGQRGRKSGSTRLSVEMSGVRMRREARGGSDREKDRERERETGRDPARRPYWRNSRGRDPINNGATSRHVPAARRARTREGAEGGCEGDARASRESRYIYMFIALRLTPCCILCIHTRLCFYLVDVGHTCARM